MPSRYPAQAPIPAAPQPGGRDASNGATTRPPANTPLLLAKGHSSSLGHTNALEELHRALEQETAQRLVLQQRCEGMQTELAKTRSELTQVRSDARRARHLAMHDELTTLPNRRRMLLRLTQALAQSSADTPGLAVLYVDLDGFKQVNDLHGHRVGDEILCITAARLRSGVRQGDTVARMGGDEFACLLPGMVIPAHLHYLCTQLFDAIAAPIQIGPLRLQVRPSIGIAISEHRTDKPVVLIERADVAMYAAKRNQCGVAFYEFG